MNDKYKRSGVVLAAGIGSRLESFSSKPLIPVSNIELLLRTLRNLECAKCETIAIVLGWKAELIEEYISSNYKGGSNLHFVFNPNYELQNGISVLCARPYIENEFILTMADHILDDNIMRLINGHSPPEGGATLCVDYKLNTIFDMDDATKVYAEGNLIKCIGKKIQRFNCIDTGVFIGTVGLIDAIASVYKNRGDASLSEGVQLLADRGKMDVLDIKDAFWQDVDTPEMLVHAEKILKENKKN